MEIAEKATKAIYDRRSTIGLVGNHINIETGHWTLKESGIGSSIDSFFEYLFKGYLLFGTESYNEMFIEVSGSTNKKSSTYTNLSKLYSVINQLKNIYIKIIGIMMLI